MTKTMSFILGAALMLLCCVLAFQEYQIVTVSRSMTNLAGLMMMRRDDGP